MVIPILCIGDYETLAHGVFIREPTSSKRDSTRTYAILSLIYIHPRNYLAEPLARPLPFPLLFTLLHITLTDRATRSKSS